MVTAIGTLGDLRVYDTDRGRDRHQLPKPSVFATAGEADSFSGPLGLNQYALGFTMQELEYQMRVRVLRTVILRYKFPLLPLIAPS